MWKGPMKSTNLKWKFVWGEEEEQEQGNCRPIIMSPQLKLSWSLELGCDNNKNSMKKIWSRVYQDIV